MIGAMQRDAQGVPQPRRGAPVQGSAREEGMSTLRLQGVAGIRQVQGVGKARTRQRE